MNKLKEKNIKIIINIFIKNYKYLNRPFLLIYKYFFN